MDTQVWMRRFLETVQDTFGTRLVFVGLQGSRARGEAAERSDIDVVVVLDHLSISDLERYRAAAAALPDRELLCGFVSGREELAAWDRADLFQFYHDTVPYFGNLEFLRPLIGPADIRRAVHRGACDIYHACCHNYLHENDEEVLRACFKSAFFVLQAKYFLESGCYVSRRSDLLPRLSGRDREVMVSLLGGDFMGNFSEYSAMLLEWTSELIRKSL